MNKEQLLNHIEKIHTTKMGKERIAKNIKINSEDSVDYCKNKIMKNNCQTTRKGKNWYCEVDNIIITVNAFSYTIITAHLK